MLCGDFYIWANDKRSGNTEALQNKVSAAFHGGKGENDEAITEAVVNRPQVIVKSAC